jgi:HEAT repeat protein
VPDQQQAWNDLIRLTNDEFWDVRYRAAEALGSAFSQVPDQQQTWNDLIRLANDEDRDVRLRAASALGSVFSQMSDKQQAWNDLHRLANDEDRDVRLSAASALGSVFSQVPDKQQAWNDLHRLTNDEDSNVRYRAASALGSVFSQVPDKQQAWNDLHRLTNDKDRDVRSIAANALVSKFSQVPDQQQAWNDLIRLTNDEFWDVRYRAAEALGSAFSQVPDKQQAWNDLHRLANDEDRDVRQKVAKALGSAFSQVPDKQQAWNDLHRLTNDEDSEVRLRAANALGSAYSQVLDKQQALNDLHRLTSDEDYYVRSYSNHSLGRVSIFMASQAETEENYKKELEKAIKFFETAAKESPYTWFNPAQFCLPFYRSFHTIIFKKQVAREEVDRYLAEAKSAIKGSESKNQLFETVGNLSEALKEVQNMGNLDLSGMKYELNFYRKYFDHAAELMKKTDEKAQLATAVLRKGLPILDRNLKAFIEEIQKKAEIACKESKGTATEKITCTIYREIQKWEIGSQEEMAFNVENLIFTLESSIPRILENQDVFNRIQQVREQKDVAKQYGIISTIIPLIPKLYMEQTVGELKNNIREIKEKVDYVIISLKPGIKEEIEISVGTEILGTGVTHKIMIPLQEISYTELKDDLLRIKGKHITKLSKLPERLARKIKDYLLLKDREDIIDQLT